MNPPASKNLENAVRIDHILTNHSKRFHSSGVYETDLPDLKLFSKEISIISIMHYLE